MGNGRVLGALAGSAWAGAMAAPGTGAPWRRSPPMASCFAGLRPQARTAAATGADHSDCGGCGRAVRPAGGCRGRSSAAPGWLGAVIDACWQEVYGQRIDNWRLPASAARRRELAVRYGRDGYRLLDAARGPRAPAWLGELPAVAALRQIWVQQYYRVIDEHGERVIWREAGEHGLPPGRTGIVSPYDLDARYSEKRGKGWLGYKVHLTETCTQPAGDHRAPGRPAAPNLITGVATTTAEVPDVAMAGPIHDGLEAA